MTIQQLAEVYLGAFKTLKRKDGREVWITTKDAPEEIQEMAMDAHESMMPDDYKHHTEMGLMGDLMMGQYAEREQVYHSVKSWLEDHADE